MKLRIPIGEGITGTAAFDRKPVVVDDVRNYPSYIEAVKGARSELAVPLIAHSQLVGVLDIESKETGYFREEQVRLLSLLASQIAIAIDNAKIYESERKSRELLELLYEISLDMASTLEIDELVKKIAAGIKTKIDYHIFSIFLLDERDSLLKPKFIIRSNEQEHRKLALPLGTGLVGTAAQSNEPLRVGDVTKDSRYLNIHSETLSELVVPLTFKGKVVGVLSLESKERNYFTESHQRFLMTLGLSRSFGAGECGAIRAGLGQRTTDGSRDEDRAGNPAPAHAG